MKKIYPKKMVKYFYILFVLLSTSVFQSCECDRSRSREEDEEDDLPIQRDATRSRGETERFQHTASRRPVSGENPNSYRPYSERSEQRLEFEPLKEIHNEFSPRDSSVEKNYVREQQELNELIGEANREMDNWRKLFNALPWPTKLAKPDGTFFNEKVREIQKIIDTKKISKIRGLVQDKLLEIKNYLIQQVISAAMELLEFCKANLNSDVENHIRTVERYKKALDELGAGVTEKNSIESMLTELRNIKNLRGSNIPVEQAEAYKVLGLKPGATKDDVKKAYLRLAKTHHPDRGGTTEGFRKIQEAKECLIGK